MSLLRSGLMIPESRVKESHDDVISHCDPELTRVVVVVIYLGEDENNRIWKRLG
jgi:hypothetical protein